MNSDVKDECKNVLHLIEILFCTPFTNAKVERGFSRMARVKSDFRSQLSRSRLAVCFRISEEGRPITKFKPDAAIELWYSDKVRRLGSTNHIKYTKRKATKDSIPLVTSPMKANPIDFFTNFIQFHKPHPIFNKPI